jgi:polyadenylate-binding protein
LDPALTEAQLQAKFEEHGKTTSVAIMRNPDGTSKGFGFVCYEKHDDANAAVDKLQGQPLGTKKIWCGPAQKKSEREQELKTKFRVLKLEQMTKYSGINLYIKNLEDEITEERLKKEFTQFGNIKSARIMVDEKGNSRGFGFVCYSTPEEAQRAIAEMNTRILQGCTKPLYVALHEPKEVRRHKLLQRHNSRTQVRAGPVPTPSNVYPTTAQQVYYPGVPTTAYFYPPNQVVPRGGRGTWTSTHPAGHYAGPGGAPPGTVYSGQPQGGAPPGRAGRGGSAAGAPPGNGRGGQGSSNRRGRSSRNNNVPGDKTPEQPGYDSLTIEFLNQFPPENQKMVLGERLYPLISKFQPTLAGKITGMLLDSGYTHEDLLALIKDEEKLHTKIEEAVEVLHRASVLPAEPGAQ